LFTANSPTISPSGNPPLNYCFQVLGKIRLEIRSHSLLY